jgi:hypothetical protein
MCHTRLQANATIIKCAQGNFPGDRVVSFTVRRFAAKDPETALKIARYVARSLVQTPWANPDPHENWFNAPLEEHLGYYEAIPPGIFLRHRSSAFAPTQLPDLIGIKDRRYLDKSGLQRHRGVADLMRYAALNQGADDLGDYSGFIPASPDFRTTVDPTTQERYSDEQLYALALYLYSIKPPVNPNRTDALAKRGSKVFEAQGCGGCHTPRHIRTTCCCLWPASDPQGAPDQIRHSGHPIGTDPIDNETRRGTGYYKVPSLKGVGHRGPFEHNGSIATLEDCRREPTAR